MNEYPNKLSAVAAHETLRRSCRRHTNTSRHQQNTRSPLYAGFCWCTRGVLTFLTAITFITGQAEAEERGGLVDAGASILTRIRLAVVYVCEEEQEAWSSQ